MKYKDLEERILYEAEDKGLLELENLLNQFNKLKNSVEDLYKVTITKSNGFKEYINSSNNKIGKVEEDMPNGLGKILYELIIFAEINGVSLEYCLIEVYKNIKRNESISKSN